MRLYLKIWLAVVFAVVLLTSFAGWAWRATQEPQPRVVHVHDDAGNIVGYGQVLPPHWHPPPSLRKADKETPEGAEDTETPGILRGPSFTVTMLDGKTLFIHIPRPKPRSEWIRAPFGFLWTLILVSIAVAAATYPIVRRLTKRLEILQRGVERWGDGDLSSRVQLQGKDEVGFLAGRFNLAAERIQSLVQAHKTLLANASHELRSPLARIRMGVELSGASAGVRSELERSIAELDELIGEILLASRLESPETDVGTPESVDLTGLVAEECARTGALLDAQSVSVMGIPKLLRRLVRNLLENARRYGGGDVHVVLRQHADRAELRVIDQGPGVPAELRERIFEPFYRLPGASEREGGVGLGLALVKAIATRHQGSVHCEAAPAAAESVGAGHGPGACFVVSLPAVAPEV